jgi:antitoxin MazE
MRASVVSIGNSKGIRIPKAILKQCGIAEEVEMSVEGGRIILSPLSSVPRQDWRESLAAMHSVGEEAPLWPEALDLDATEWDWE